MIARSVKDYLLSLDHITAICGDRVFGSFITQPTDVYNDGPAITITVITDINETDLAMQYFPAIVRLQLDIWTYDEYFIEVLYLYLKEDLTLGNTNLGDCRVINSRLLNSTQRDEPPEQYGNDAWLYRRQVDFQFQYLYSPATITGSGGIEFSGAAEFE